MEKDDHLEGTPNAWIASMVASRIESRIESPYSQGLRGIADMIGPGSPT